MVIRIGRSRNIVAGTHISVSNINRVQTFGNAIRRIVWEEKSKAICKDSGKLRVRHANCYANFARELRVKITKLTSGASVECVLV